MGRTLISRRASCTPKQRADRYNNIGKPKSASPASCTIPLPPVVVSTLREWKLKCPKARLRRAATRLGRTLPVFPNGAGNVENHQNILTRGFFPDPDGWPA